MKTVIKSTDKNLIYFGRTLADKDRDAVFFNWTGAGFAFRFTGTRVEMKAVAFADSYPGEGKNLPWLAVLIDDVTKPYRLIPLDEGSANYILFESETVQTHTIKVIKRSEVSKGRAGLQQLEVWGDIAPCHFEKPPYHLEFIGDSITCGFGGEMAADNMIFSTKEENGLEAYPAIAAGLLGASYHSICISGIPLCWARDPNYRIVLPEFPDFKTPQHTMMDFYEYTDRFHQQSMGLTDDFTRWNFSQFKPDVIVVNLGTNDAFRMRVSGNDPKEETHFMTCYIQFLHTLRACNGASCIITAALGPMDYFLYNTIEKAVELYKSQSNDENIFSFKFGAIDPWGEGIGGLGHPSAKTQLRMGKELAKILEERLDKASM